MGLYQYPPHYNAYSQTNSTLLKWQTIFPDYTTFKLLVFDQLKLRWQDIAQSWYLENNIHYYLLETLWDYLDFKLYDWNWYYNTRVRCIRRFIQIFEQEYINIFYAVRAYLDLKTDFSDWEKLLFKGSQSTNKNLTTTADIPATPSDPETFNADYVSQQTNDLGDSISLRTDYSSQLKKVLKNGINLPMDEWTKKFEVLFTPLVKYSY